MIGIEQLSSDLPNANDKKAKCLANNANKPKKSRGLDNKLASRLRDMRYAPKRAARLREMRLQKIKSTMSDSEQFVDYVVARIATDTCFEPTEPITERMVSLGHDWIRANINDLHKVTAAAESISARLKRLQPHMHVEVLEIYPKHHRVVFSVMPANIHIVFDHTDALGPSMYFTTPIAQVSVFPVATRQEVKWVENILQINDF